MWKLPQHGGIKLINLDLKSQSAQAQWLIQLASNENFSTNLNIFSRLMGPQKGDIKGKDLFFLQKSYHQRILKTTSTFYKSSLLALANLDIKKGIQNVESWGREHIFYNTVFLTADKKTEDRPEDEAEDKVLTLTGYCEKNKVYRYEQLLQEKHKEQQKLKYDKALLRLLNKIKINTTLRRNDVLVRRNNGDELEFSKLSQKIIYEELLYKTINLHPSVQKWGGIFPNTFLDWDEIWETVFNFLSNNSTKALIWQQLHLNFYTQYSYNKWHGKQDPCPLCSTLPQDRHHIIFECQFSRKMWSHLEPCIKSIHPSNVTQEEKAFGIVQKKTTTGILLRNWITYLLREFIAEQERIAHHSSKSPKLGQAKHLFNTKVDFEVKKKLWRYKNDGNISTFNKFFTHNQVLCKLRTADKYEILNIFRIFRS